MQVKDLPLTHGDFPLRCVQKLSLRAIGGPDHPPTPQSLWHIEFGIAQIEHRSDHVEDLAKAKTWGGYVYFKWEITSFCGYLEITIG